MVPDRRSPEHDLLGLTATAVDAEPTRRALRIQHRARPTIWDRVLVLREQRLPRWTPIAVAAGLFVAALSRSPFIFVRGRFWAEEGQLQFSRMVADPFPKDLLYIQVRTGYMNSFCNLATWIADQVPIRQAPLVTAWISLALLGVIVWVALFWPSELLPTAASRVAAATLLVIGTIAVPEVWANSVNSPTYLGVLTLLLMFVKVRRIGRVRFLAGAAMLAIASVSGIYSALFAPFFILRAYQQRSRRRIAWAAAISAGALIQFALVMQNRGRGDLATEKMKFPSWSQMARESAGHVGTFLLGLHRRAELSRDSYEGNRLWVMVAVALAVVLLLAVVLTHVPNRRVALMLGAAFVMTELLVAYGALRGGPRYSVVPVAILTVAAIHGAATARGRWLSLAATAMCAMVLLFGVSSFWDAHDPNLRCHGCPVWTSQVAAWQRGEIRKLKIWPAGWVVHLPPQPPHEDAKKRRGGAR